MSATVEGSPTVHGCQRCAAAPGQAHLPVCEDRPVKDSPTCTCVQHDDGSTTTFLCSLHATTDPCLTMAQVTGTRRKGTIRRGVCTACGWGAR